MSLRIRATLALAAAATLALFFAHARAAERVSLGLYPPPNPKARCTVSQTQFGNWQSAAGSAAFDVPDNAAFVPDSANPDCSFYKQMAQMFLWLTSPQQGYPYVFMGSQFFNVTGFDSANNPIFTPNDPTSGRAVRRGAFQLRATKSQISGTGQAGGSGAQLSQQGALVYYAIHVNDVYVALQDFQANVPYFTSGASQGNFPTSAAQVVQIAAAATTGFPNGFPDANALSIELKTAWIDAATIPAAQRSSFLTLLAEVPSFQTPCPASPPPQAGDCLQAWDGSSYAVKTLALVGMHVVSAVNKHPELVWSTFEHGFNAPNNSFAVVGPDDLVFPFSYDPNAPSGTFFQSGTALADANQEGMKSVAGPTPPWVDLAATTPGGQGGPASAVRYRPWGGLQPANPTASDPTVLNNTTLVSLALSLVPQVAALAGSGGARALYIQTGAVWTVNGGVPTAAPTTPTSSGQPALAGSPVLANTTMETFHQVSNGQDQAGCFGCHFNFGGQSSTTQSVNVSHVFNLNSSSALAQPKR